MRLFATSALALFSLGFAVAQKDQPSKFTSGIDLVTSAVVVHDAQGRAVGNLRAGDFAIFDKGKPQKITVFNVEHMTAPKAVAGGTTGEATTATAEADRAAPERYVAYVFDDRQLKGETFIRLREAARKHMAQLRPGDHAAIFTTSNSVLRNFTTNTEELQQTLLKLSPGQTEGRHCPDLNFYEADLIINKQDYDATMVAVYEANGICGLPLPAASSAGTTSRPGQPAPFNANAPPNVMTSQDVLSSTIQGVARSVFAAGERRTRDNLELIGSVVGLLSGAPGERILVLASPGFLTPQESLEKDVLMDRASRNQVVINSLDARGLYADSGLAITSHNSVGGVLQTYPYAAKKGELVKMASRAETNVLAELAYGTGGTFFENNNDLAEGFRQVAVAPEYLYLIGFTPEKLKLDGNFHPLKVELKNQPGLTVESARKGYYAGKAK